MKKAKPIPDKVITRLAVIMFIALCLSMVYLLMNVTKYKCVSNINFRSTWESADGIVQHKEVQSKVCTRYVQVDEDEKDNS